MTHTHQYLTELTWTGNLGEGTRRYTGYARDHEIRVAGKPPLPGSSDPQFRGDSTRYNPEEMLVASLSACHMLWFLHLCASAGVVVTAYTDAATGRMVEAADGGGHFEEVVLRPQVEVSEASMIGKTARLHGEAHRLCFIARSVNFPVRHEPACRAAGE